MIYTILDVKKVCNAALTEAFGGEIKVYDNDTLDGYERPSFFTEIISHGRPKVSLYLTQIGFTFRITYFEETHDEAACLEVYETICEAFEPALKVSGNIRILVDSIDYDWIGENLDMLQATVSFQNAVELGGNSEDADIIETVEIDTEIEESEE